MLTEVTSYTTQGHVAYITMRRPEALNAMNEQMHVELAEIWDHFEAAEDLWVGVLTGAGERSFSVGQDLKEAASRIRQGEPPTSLGSRGRPGWPRLTERFNVRKPLIARINGFALGGGLEMALACDVIIACQSAEFGFPEARLGLVPGAGGIFRLCQQIPRRLALGLLMTGQRFSAAQALQMGMVNEVVSDDQLDVRVQHWIDALVTAAPLAVRAIKEMAYASAHLPLQQAFSQEYDSENDRLKSRDSSEGILAFVEQRRPIWSGK